MHTLHTRSRSFARTLACTLLLGLGSPALHAAQAQAEAAFDWLNATTFAPGSEIDTTDGRGTFIAFQRGGSTPVTLDDAGLGWAPLRLASLPGAASAGAETTGTQGRANAAADDGAARADALVAGILSYTGLFARSITVTVPYTLRALVNAADGSATAQVFAGYEFLGSAVGDDVSALASAAVFGVPADDGGTLTLTLDFDPDLGRTQALLNISALVEASAAPTAVPLPLPLLLFGSGLIVLPKIRRR
jgi:hypothetical protein